MKEQSYLHAEGDLNLSPSRQKWNQGIKDPETLSAIAEDADFFLHQSLSSPCLDVLSSSEGIRIKNTQGKSYIDFHGNSVHQLGYHNSFILDKVKEQMDILPFCPRRFTNIPSIDLAKRLTTLTNHELSRVLFAPGGASAISMALKIARIYTGKYKTLAMYDSFHGATMDTISLGGEYMFQQGLGPLMPGSIHVPPVDTYRGMWFNPNTQNGDLAYADYLEYVIEKEGDIGVLVAETIRSTVIHVPSKEYWKRVREICDKHNIVLVLDEIPIGLGRTGKIFAYQHYDIVPDIVVLGKGLGAGIVPMAAIVCKEKLNVAAQVSIGHFTHEKSPLGAVAALASFDYIDQFEVLEKVAELSIYLKSQLLELKEKYSCIGDVRGLGLLWGIELVKNSDPKQKDREGADRVLYKCLELGLSLKVSEGNVLSLYPPLVITKEELDQALQVLETALSEITASEQKVK